MEQRTPEWFEARKGRITASEVGAILGHHPDRKRKDVMRAKVREWHGADSEFDGNIATEYGRGNEEAALQDYRLETLHDVERVGFIQYEDWAGCSPDGLIGNKGGLEIKCPFGKRKDGEEVTFKKIEDQPHYYDQVQFSLFCSGRQWWHFWQWTSDGFAIQTVRPDQDWIDKNIPILRQFYAEYLNEREEHAADHLGPARNEINTPEALALIKTIEAADEGMKRLKLDKSKALEQLADMAGHKNALVCGHKLTRVERAGSVQYAKVVKDNLPDLDLSPYTGKPTAYWKLS